MSDWQLFYEKAIRPDGSLYFPERLTHEFLEKAKRIMGSYLFANQYQNEIIPEGQQDFKKQWIKYYQTLPAKKHTFAFIDPAISLSESADFTALCVVDVDEDQIWYLRHASRYKITPTQIMDLVFKTQEYFKCDCIGIEEVAYQKALLYMLDEEMRRRNQLLPVKGVKPSNDKSKEMRIRGLVPRFEWGRILMSQGLHDFEMEYSQFPRGSHDDLLDSLAYLEQIIFYPQKEGRNPHVQPVPNDPAYESWYIKQLVARSGTNAESGEFSDDFGESNFE